MEGKRRVAGLGPVPHPMSPLCFPGGSCCNQLAPAWPDGIHVGMDSGAISPTFLFNDQPGVSLTPSHSFAFYQERGNECTVIDFQGISAPREGEPIICIRDTFLSLVN